MEHVEILKENESLLKAQGVKSLTSRAMGRFYTHEKVGRHLVTALLNAHKFKVDSTIRVLDPFCGDGRLIYWLIDEFAKYPDSKRYIWKVELWDYDEDAIQQAKQNVERLASRLDLQIDVTAIKGDTFILAQQYFGRFHLIITNPPWEVLKPDKRELSRLQNGDIDGYIASLKRYSNMLAKLYPMSIPQGKFLGWGTNLARFGTEVALRLTHADGICGIVSPASLLADQVSTKLRQWIFKNHTVYDLSFFPAEAKLFDRVDQPAITMVASPKTAKEVSPIITIYDKRGEIEEQTRLAVDRDDLERRNFIIPVHFGIGPMHLFDKWKLWPTFADLEGSGPKALWAGRELDETGYRHFIADEGEHLFVKGYMVRRFTMAEMPTMFVRRDGPQIPKSVAYHRIAWRDVSRQNQKRRIIATLIPPGWVTGNSLNVAYFRDNDVERLKALLAIISSFVFEFQVRSSLSTAHVSLGSVRIAHIPPLMNPEVVTSLSRLTDQCLSGHKSAHFALEVRVAQLYNLSREEFKVLLSSFGKIEEEEIKELLSEPL